MKINEVIVEHEQINEALPAAAVAMAAWGAASGGLTWYSLQKKHGTNPANWPKSAQAELLSGIVLGSVGGPVGSAVTKSGLWLAGRLGVGKRVINLVKAGVTGKNADKVKKTLDRVEPTISRVKPGDVGKGFMDDVRQVYAKKGLNPDGSKIPPAPTAVAGAVDDAAAAVAKPGAIRRGANAVGRSVGKVGTKFPRTDKIVRYTPGALVTPAVGRVAGAPEAIRDYDRGEAEVDSKGNFTGGTTGPNIGGAYGTATSHVDKDENLDFYDKTGMLMTKQGDVVNPADYAGHKDPRTGKPFHSPENLKRQQAYQRQQGKDQLGK